MGVSFRSAIRPTHSSLHASAAVSGAAPPFRHPHGGVRVDHAKPVPGAEPHTRRVLDPVRVLRVHRAAPSAPARRPRRGGGGAHSRRA